jgi:hypothetical protein
MDSFNPVTVTTAIFLAIFFMDLFNHRYKTLPVHALVGFFCIMLVSMLYQLKLYGTAWLLVLTPFLFIIGSIMIRDHRIFLSDSTTLQPNSAPNKHCAAPYFI